MRKYIVLSILFSCFTLFQLQAQQEDVAQSENIEMTAEKAAAAVDSIEKSVCGHSGKVSYYKKSVCPMSGKVSKQAVEWNQAEAKFVSLNSENAHQKHSMKKSCCSGKKSKSCSKKCAKTCGKSNKSADASNNLTEEAKKDVKVLRSSNL